LGQPALQHAAQNLQAVQFLAAHCQGFRLVHAGLQGQQGARNPTFLLCCDILFAGIAIYRTLPKAQLALPIYPQREIVSKITESIVRAAIA
jgi:hypothetical protein